MLYQTLLCFMNPFHTSQFPHTFLWCQAAKVALGSPPVPGNPQPHCNSRHWNVSFRGLYDFVVMNNGKGRFWGLRDQVSSGVFIKQQHTGEANDK